MNIERPGPILPDPCCPEKDEEIARLRACLRRAGLGCFMSGGTQEEVAEHMHRVSGSWIVVERKLRSALVAAQAALATAQGYKMSHCAHCEGTRYLPPLGTREVKCPGCPTDPRILNLVEVIRRGLTAPSGAPLCRCLNVNAVAAGTERSCWYCEIRAALASLEQP
jgi:hypothetical protein